MTLVRDDALLKRRLHVELAEVAIAHGLDLPVHAPVVDPLLVFDVPVVNAVVTALAAPVPAIIIVSRAIVEHRSHIIPAVPLTIG